MRLRRGARVAFALLLLLGSLEIANVAGGASAPDGDAHASSDLVGRLEIAHGDRHGHLMTMQAAIETSTGRVRLHIPAAQHGRFLALAGKRVRVHGHRVVTAFSADSVTAMSETSSILPAAPRVMRVAVVLMHLPGSSVEPTSVAAAQTTFFDPNDSVAAYFREVSAGATTVTGKVFGYYNAPPGMAPGDCYLDHWTNAAAAAAARDGYTTLQYEYIVVVTPRDETCQYGGVGFVSMSGVRINGVPDIRIASHELGHNLGLMHAGGLVCGAQLIVSSCTRDDYGDVYDVMGLPVRSPHYNASHKAMLGWLPSDEVRTASGGAADIALTPSAYPVAGATELINVPRGDGYSYAIENRKPFGKYDQGASGVFIRLVGSPELDQSTDDTRLLDMTPNSAKGFSDANLVAGKTFVDGARGITIKNVSEPASGAAQIEVCVGACPQPLVGVLTGKVNVIGTQLTDHISALQVNATTIDISTFGRPIRFAGGCVALAPDRARCTASGSYLAGYGGDDLLEAGGSMANTLDGGPGNDLLRGGYGPDTFIGGTGVDTADYSTRFGEAITGTPGTGADDGHPGEDDNITADVEKVLYPLW